MDVQCHVGMFVESYKYVHVGEYQLSMRISIAPNQVLDRLSFRSFHYVT